jgi:5-hydroxyisourate hydrolase-like protein (transthyretin family)
VFAFEYSGNAVTLEEASDIAVSGRTTYDAELGLAGRIAGNLTGPDGQAVGFGFVAVFAESVPLGDVLFIQQLPANQQTYEIGGLPTGRYIARYSGQVDGLGAQEYYENTPDAAFATPIEVTAGQTTAIDVVLGERSGLDLAGHVTDAGGSVVAGIEVSIYRWTGQDWSYQDFQNTSADGTYAFDDLAPGDYRLLFRDWGGDFAFQYWPNAATLDEAQVVTLDGVSQSVDAVMQPAGRITGQLSDPAGRPLFNPLIAVYGAWDPDQVLFIQQPAGVDYNVGGLPSGELPGALYRQQSNNRSYREYFDGSADAEGATPVAVEVGETTSAIDARLGLGPGGTIRGRLRDRYGEELDIGRVTALNRNDGQWVEVSSVEAFYLDDDFDYLLDVPAGRYRLRFDGGSFLAPGGQLYTEFFDDTPTINAAADLDVQTGDELRGVDVRLGNFAGGTLSGKVTDAQGNPASGVEVLLFDRSLRFLSDQVAVTDAGGDYTVTGLWPEAYFVRFYDPLGELQNRWYVDAGSPSSAERVPVDGDVVGVDAALSPAPADAPGSVSGIVTDGAGPTAGPDSGAGVYRLRFLDRTADLRHRRSNGNGFGRQLPRCATSPPATTSCNSSHRTAIS